MTRSKRYQASLAKIDKKKLYTPDEAIELLKEFKNPRFDSTLEVHINLGIDLQKSDQHVKGAVSLPHFAGKKKKIAAFVTPGKEKEAKDAGADIVGGEDIIKKIQTTKKCDFDIAVAEPSMMKVLAPIAKILGPRGLMPNPKAETVSPNIKKMIGELIKGRINFKMDSTGNLHQALGKISDSKENLLENFKTFMEVVDKAKPDSVKGIFINSVTLTTTMSPGVKIKH